MGVEGVAIARAVASPPARTAAPKRHSLASAAPDSPLDLGRRRTSIPSSFTYGTDDDDVSPEIDAERRWRSFDVPSAGASARLATLASRIEAERAQLSAAELAARPSRRRALFASFRSATRKEQVELRRMEMVARVAKCNRSLAVLRDTLTTLELSAQEASVVSNDASSASLLDAVDADAVLAEDCVHHVLELQLQFLRRSAALHGDKTPVAELAPFLAEFAADGVPCALDAPTRALVRFEKLLVKTKALKPSLKRSLDALCRDTLASFARPTTAKTPATTLWETRAPQDVLPSLVRELEDSVMETARVPESARAVLRTFLEQMVFSRLAGACYRSLAVELDEQNATWREQTTKARALQLDEVGLPVEVPADLTSSAGVAFARSIAAFNALPHLVPSSVLGAFLSAVRVLYEEANALLGIASGCISADVLLPLLVFVLSRAELPHLHAQVFLMEQFALDASQEGSEAAYYLACLQAAMGYIMTEVGKASPEATDSE